jgi:hypothetical protein
MKAQLEPIAQSGEKSILSRHVVEPSFKHPLHYHPEIEIACIVRSRGTFVIGDHVGEFKEGDVFLIGSNLQHLFTNTLPPGNGAEAEVLQFHREFSNGFLDETPEMRAFVTLLKRARFGLRLRSSKARGLAEKLSEIRLAGSFNRILGFMELAGRLISSRDYETLSSPGYVGKSTDLNSSRMQTACQYILDHFSEEIRHKDLAAKVHLAPASFSQKPVVHSSTKFGSGMPADYWRKRTTVLRRLPLPADFNRSQTLIVDSTRGTV